MPQRARVPGNGGVVPADGWFETEDRPYVLRMEVPLSVEEMVAALYSEHNRLTPAELASDQDVRGHIAVTLLAKGQPAIGYVAEQVREAEQSGSGVRAPAWLALCRRRVAEVTGCTPATAGQT
ncbi:MAG TPA: hypothetical protein VFB06_06830 [Streptosporangiaceae bacterium]|nr:hypothetical protein [Streptosporangiaceae bacterium]